MPRFSAWWIVTPHTPPLLQVNTARDAALLISEELNLTPSTPKAVLPTPPSEDIDPLTVEQSAAGVGGAPPHISANPIPAAGASGREDSPQNRPQGSGGHLRAVRDMIQQVSWLPFRLSFRHQASLHHAFPITDCGRSRRPEGIRAPELSCSQ